MRQRFPLPALGGAALAAAALAAPSAATAAVVEIGSAGDAARPTCPSTDARPCTAVTRTTAFQVKVGTNRTMMTVPRDGRIVAWSVRLGTPNAKDRAFFQDELKLGAASARLAVLRKGRTTGARVLAETPNQELARYFGTTAQFPLEQTIPVQKGQVIALTVPSWAPVLATGLPTSTSWRAHRTKKQCTAYQVDTTLAVMASGGFGCVYPRERLAYEAVLVTNPTAAKR